MTKREREALIVQLFISYGTMITGCRIQADYGLFWRSMKDENGQPLEPGYFLLGIGTRCDLQMRMTLPMNRFESCYSARELSKAPAWDGHSVADITKRLQIFIGA
jgi:hypothetical protein